MACTIQFMAFLQILPFVFRFLDRKISIQVSIRLLCFLNHFYNCIRSFLKRLIRLYNKGICGSFQPFCHIAVLKYHPVEFAVFQPRRDTEIGKCVAFFHAFHFIIQHLFLKGNDNICYHLLLW